MRQKFAVVPSQTQERLDLFPVSRSREVKQRVDLLLTRPHSVCQLNSYKDIMQMVQVIVPRTTKYHNIIQISFAVILKTFENFIYEPIERCWRVTEAKSHVTPLPVSLRGHKPSQVNMFRGNRYLKIGLYHVQLRHKHCST